MVVGVAHAGGGQLGPDRFQAGAGVRGQPASKSHDMPSALCSPRVMSRPPGAVVVGVVAVGVQAVHLLWSASLARSSGPNSVALPGQVGVGAVGGSARSIEAGQPGAESRGSPRCGRS